MMTLVLLFIHSECEAQLGVKKYACQVKLTLKEQLYIDRS
jgi:hypothetical protein